MGILTNPYSFVSSSPGGGGVPTDGLVGRFMGGEGITLDTTAGRDSVSTWVNQVDGATWDLTQTTKSLQPSYDSGNELVQYNGTYYNVFPGDILAYNANWTVVFITDVITGNWWTMLGAANAFGYIKPNINNSLVFFRMDNFAYWYPPYDSTASPLTNANFNVVGMSYPGAETGAGPSNINNFACISNQYLFTADPDTDPSLSASFTAPVSYRPITAVSNLNSGGANTNGIAQDIKEILFYDKQLDQSEATDIYDYADALVTLNVLPDDMDYYGSP